MMLASTPSQPLTRAHAGELPSHVARTHARAAARMAVAGHE
jgi:hypothetical protein